MNASEALATAPRVPAPGPLARVVLPAPQLDGLMRALLARGYTIIGPTHRDDAIVLDEVRRAADLPAGWTDDQEAAHYAVRPREDAAVFGYAVGPHAWKRWLHPPDLRLWAAHREPGGFRLDPDVGPAPRLALFGVRACDLAAIERLDTVLDAGPYPSAYYRAVRRQAFVLVAQCTMPASTCFCASMGTGPRARHGFDLALTEVLGADEHVFVVEVGSARGAEVVGDLAPRPATAEEIAAAASLTDHAAAGMGRTLDVTGVREALPAVAEHPRWEQVAGRCLTCGSCTQVCPTCFCTTVDDVLHLTGTQTERWRRWDSCFTVEYSYMHGGSVRMSPRSRYRQWLTHKLGAWHEQFGESGCVGCGRCITWCPVGIDITAEAAAFCDAAAHAVPTNGGGS
jgi:ferredoxin